MIKICRFYRAEDVTSRIYSNGSNYSSLFLKFFKFRCCSFVSLKKKLQLPVIVQVCCLFYFLVHGTLFKGKEKSGIFGGFYCFFKWGFKKTRVFLVRSKYMNPEDKYGLN